MLFSSLLFIFIFFPLCLLIYYLVPFKFKNIVLLIFSLIFYAWGEPKFILLMLLVSLLNYISGLIIDKNDNKKIKKYTVVICVILNLLLLGFFKYTNFIIENLNNFGMNLDALNIILPLGISFYIFQTMSYTIDLYWGKVKVEKNFFTFLTYVSMFPQLVAGPIVRYEDVAKELKSRKIDFNCFSDGLYIFLTGLFMKVLIANNVGYLHSLILGDISNISLMTAWLGIVAYAIQIYFDFNGYSTMALGMGKMLGFKYPKNFNYPYIATSITDFWRRWHMTLSTWFRDYVYIPLGGNRVKKYRWLINIMIVWSLTGIWHGADWNFIIWGIYFGVILIIEKLFIGKYLEKLPKFLKHTYALFLILVGWLIFFCDDLSLLISYTQKSFMNTNIIDKEFIFYIKNYFIFIVSGIVFSIPFIDKIKLNKVLKVLLVFVYIFLFIVCVCQLCGDSYNPFLYFRF